MGARSARGETTSASIGGLESKPLLRLTECLRPQAAYPVNPVDPAKRTRSGMAQGLHKDCAAACAFK